MCRNKMRWTTSTRPNSPTILVSFLVTRTRKACYSLIPLQKLSFSDFLKTLYVLQQYAYLNELCIFSLLYQINLFCVKRNDCQVCSFCTHFDMRTECTQCMMRFSWAVTMPTINLVLSTWLLSAHLPSQKELVLTSVGIGDASALTSTAA
jgi:hypothetical protein